MSFISIRYDVFSDRGQEDTYIITDDDIGQLRVVNYPGSDSFACNVGVMIAKFYSERNLNVGKNLALASIFFRRMHGYDINITTQDKRCPTYIPNWEQYAKERDKYLEKLLALM